MTQRGTHTWDLILHYHKCPSCGMIIESRQDYKYRLGKYQKALECRRCHHEFIVYKPSPPRFGPLFGSAQPTEMDWDTKK